MQPNPSGSSAADPAAAARHEQNRRSWNAVVPAHASHRGDLAAFLRAGGSTLFPEERALLGDLAGRSAAHLLCNAGADTLSLAQAGASVTGVDISDAAIRLAEQLAAQSGLRARFVRADVYEWLAAAASEGLRFDVIYCGYGAICWLHDLSRWARGVAALLRPGGRCVVVEFHPASNMFDSEWRLAHDYPAGGRVLQLDGVGDYVGASEGGLVPEGAIPGVANFTNPEPCFLYAWGLGDVVTALAGAGLVLDALHEYPYTNGERPFARMRAEGGRRMFPPDDIPALPLMYGLAAHKPGAPDGD